MDSTRDGLVPSGTARTPGIRLNDHRRPDQRSAEGRFFRTGIRPFDYQPHPRPDRNPTIVSECLGKNWGFAFIFSSCRVYLLHGQRI